MQGVDVFDMRPLDASRKGTEALSTTVTSFTIIDDEITPVGTIRCVCGRKTLRACMGGGWCSLEWTWRKEGTRTERELKEWMLRRMIEEELEKSTER